MSVNIDKANIKPLPDEETHVHVAYHVSFVEKTEPYARALTRTLRESTYYPKESREYKLDEKLCKWVNHQTELYAKEKLKELGTDFKLVLIKTITSKTVKPFVPDDGDDAVENRKRSVQEVDGAAAQQDEAKKSKPSKDRRKAILDAGFDYDGGKSLALCSRLD